MKILLLHPEDAFAREYWNQRWDLVVDLGRAPRGTHENWREQAGCPVISIYDYAEEIDDLHYLRELLQLGLGHAVDQWGIDWWDIFSLEIASGIQRAVLIERLAKDLSLNCDLYSTRADFVATALGRLLGGRATCLGSRMQSMGHRLRRHYETFSQLGGSELLQLFEDKFDADHSIRCRFAPRRRSAGHPVVLVPSAYVNVTRTALAYAGLLPDQQFMLVVARRSGYPASTPPNVMAASLTPYFRAIDKHELASLRESWERLKSWLSRRAPEFKVVESAGFFGSGKAPFRWGLALRDAWLRVFASEQVTACLSADDSNPNTRIPLILAKNRGIPALACHHGALDFRMAIKVNHADAYLAKSEMELDYLKRICRFPAEKVSIAAPPSSTLRHVISRSPRWIVFFTEPHRGYGWRADEVYRDLLPRLFALAQNCGLKLVFKLHPFESLKGHRRMLRRLIPEHEQEIEVLAGPPTEQLWNNTRFALTVQSSTALECTALGIPVFLCSWLCDLYTGYVQQYARFGAGHILDSAEQIADIPRLLETHEKSPHQRAGSAAIDSRDFAQLLTGVGSLPLVSSA
jgi:hypothetical protein